eukprot:TRINITY_DN46045_c0_g1_i1.p1 TRINITY_DN46045_c0_g1~~TRINITY_DN46045_c0_g1_i1.p1  ORF type:complete len:150 (-),score=12.29 TRINITY_DN46045_c0_g1_i1:20-469(-)
MAAQAAFHAGLTYLLCGTPFEPTEHSGLGDFATSLTTVDLALAELREARLLEPYNVDITVVLAVAISTFVGDMDLARRMLDWAIAAKPDHYLALVTRAVAFGDFSAAQRAVQYHPDQPQAWLIMGSFGTRQIGQAVCAACMLRWLSAKA